jgi:2-oxoglutarate ferredoxin oxidoreductase subunit alpha
MWEEFGDDTPDVGVICWGETTGAVREAVARHTARGNKVGAFVPKVLNPLPREELLDYAERCGVLLVPELNSRSQFGKLLRGELGIESEWLNKYTGIPFTPGEIEQKIDELLGSTVEAVASKAAVR